MQSKTLIKEKYPTPSRYYKNVLIKKTINNYNFLKEKYFLDICGTGEVLTFLDNFNMKGMGIDLSKEACKISRSRVSDNIKIKQKDFLELKTKYGLIIMIDVLEHIKDDEKFIKKVYELLEKDGYYLLNVPAKMKQFSKADIYFGHFRRYEKDELSRLLERNRLEIIMFWSYGFSLFSKVYSNLMEKDVKDIKEKNTLESSIKTPKSMKKIYPIIGKFYWLMRLQSIFLNTNIGSHYLILCKKMAN